MSYGIRETFARSHLISEARPFFRVAPAAARVAAVRHAGHMIVGGQSAFR